MSATKKLLAHLKMCSLIKDIIYCRGNGKYVDSFQYLSQSSKDKPVPFCDIPTYGCINPEYAALDTQKEMIFKRETEKNDAM